MICRLTDVIFRLTGVQTFTAISFNSPVYGQRSIMKITGHLLKNSVVCSLHFTLSVHPVSSLQSAFYTDRSAYCVLSRAYAVCLFGC